jgi:urease accessory protein UreF
MPLVAVYDETTLAAWMVLRLGLVATVLTWTAGHPQVAEAVADVERMMGVNDVAEASDPRAVERVALVCIWRRACDNFVALYDQLIEGESFNRSQLLKQAQQSLASAQAAAATDVDLGGGTVRVVRRRYPGDPYTGMSEEDRVLR